MAAPAAAAAGGASTSGVGNVDRVGIDPAVENELLSNYLLIMLGSISAALLLWRSSALLIRHVRTVSCLCNDRQRYFARTSRKVAWWKKNIRYAPVLSKRHNREMQLSRAANMGTLPTRLQLAFLVGYIATNLVFCVVSIDFSQGIAKYGNVLRNRTGVLSTVNMVPLFLLAGRNNPLIQLLGMSFDTFNLLHRWLGRIVVAEAVTHTLTFLATAAARVGWAGAFQVVAKVEFILFGMVATSAFVAIVVQASSVLRHAFYETFKLLHIVLATTSLVGLYYHLHLKDLPQIRYVKLAVTLWILDRASRFLRIAYSNLGSGGSQCLVETLPGGAVRVNVTMARPWTFKPGQHAYLYFPTIGFWQSHPFSVAWSGEATDAGAGRADVLGRSKPTMSFVIRSRAGMTAALARKAAACPDGKLVTMCLVEGPYGGTHQMDSYGTVMLFAGGVGITHAVPHVRRLVAGFENGTVAARRIVLVWIVQSPEHLEWIRPWMTEVLAMEKRRECLRILLFVSRPHSTKEIHSPSATVLMFPGRPNIETLLEIEMEAQVGTLGVTVCGPGALSDDVRRAVRTRMAYGNIEFTDEAFSW